MSTLKRYGNSGKFKGTNEIIYGTKPVKSVISKVVARGRTFADLGDLIRGAILFDTQEQVEDFIKDFRRKEGKNILDYEIKQKGNDKTYGYYGSHHIELDVNGLKTELQVMTKRLWKFKDAAHEIYQATRELDVVPDYKKLNSKEIFDLANKKGFRESIMGETFEQFLENYIDHMIFEVEDELISEENLT